MGNESTIDWVRVHLFIYGRVHGVFFRWNTQKRAIELGLVGWVRNTSKGVEVIAEGPTSKINELVEFCKKGPLLARVDRVDIKYEAPTKDFSSFEILY